MTEAGLRERKKAATRRALADAALSLAVARGIDSVSVEDIADAAGVSPRTLFNHFASKEDAVVAGAVEVADRVVEAFDARPADEPVLEALQAAILEPLRDYASQDASALAALRLVHCSPVLAPHRLASFSAAQHRMAASVGRRTGTDPGADLYPGLVASVASAVMATAFELWIASDGTRDLRALVEHGFAAVAAGLAEPRRPAPARPGPAVLPSSTPS